jgi:hypothetical protein
MRSAAFNVLDLLVHPRAEAYQVVDALFEGFQLLPSMGCLHRIARFRYYSEAFDDGQFEPPRHGPDQPSSLRKARMDFDSESIAALAADMGKYSCSGARLHGALTGGLLLQCGTTMPAWWEHVLEAAIGDAQIGPCDRRLRQNAVLTEAALADPECGFEPMLPDEGEHRSSDRVAAAGGLVRRLRARLRRGRARREIATDVRRRCRTARRPECDRCRARSRKRSFPRSDEDEDDFMQIRRIRAHRCAQPVCLAAPRGRLVCTIERRVDGIGCIVQPHPRIAVRELARRRRELMALMGEGSIAILPSAQQVVRNRDVHYPFRQDSDFHYLSGFDEPDAVLVLVPGASTASTCCSAANVIRERENWEGPCAGPEGACARFGADDAFPVGDLDDILPGLIEGRERLYYAMGRSPGSTASC